MDETRKRIRKVTRTYARRQRTWFRSEPGVDWRTEAASVASEEGIARVTEWLADPTKGS